MLQSLVDRKQSAPLQGRKDSIEEEREMSKNVKLSKLRLVESAPCRWNITERAMEEWRYQWRRVSGVSARKREDTVRETWS